MAELSLRSSLMLVWSVRRRATVLKYDSNSENAFVRHLQAFHSNYGGWCQTSDFVYPLKTE